MDTSKEYIKMCEKAVEIQFLLNKEENNNYLYVNIKNGFIETTKYPHLYWLKRYGNGKPAKEWVSYYDSDRPCYYGNNVVWLPRQDQLQEMVDWSLEDSSGFASPNWLAREISFMTWMGRECERYRPKGFCGQAVSITSGEDGFNRAYKSPEQLWLAFVMKEKYNKIWNGEYWV